jgi:cysteinyl-tRNA synthetase
VEAGIPEEVWEMVQAANESDNESPSDEVLALVEQRKKARDEKDWGESDRLRDEIADLGWQVQDTPEGQELVKD